MLIAVFIWIGTYGTVWGNNTFLFYPLLQCLEWISFFYTFKAVPQSCRDVGYRWLEKLCQFRERSSRNCNFCDVRSYVRVCRPQTGWKVDPNTIYILDVICFERYYYDVMHFWWYYYYVLGCCGHCYDVIVLRILSQVIWFGSGSKSTKVMVGNALVSPVESIEILGLKFGRDLKSDPHINTLISSVASLAGVARHLRIRLPAHLVLWEPLSSARSGTA